MGGLKKNYFIGWHTSATASEDSEFGSEIVGDFLKARRKNASDNLSAGDDLSAGEKRARRKNASDNLSAGDDLSAGEKRARRKNASGLIAMLRASKKKTFKRYEIVFFCNQKKIIEELKGVFLLAILFLIFFLISSIQKPLKNDRREWI